MVRSEASKPKKPPNHYTIRSGEKSEGAFGGSKKKFYKNWTLQTHTLQTIIYSKPSYTPPSFWTLVHAYLPDQLRVSLIAFWRRTLETILVRKNFFRTVLVLVRRFDLQNWHDFHFGGGLKRYHGTFWNQKKKRLLQKWKIERFTISSSSVYDVLSIYLSIDL